MGVYIPNMKMPKTCFSCSFDDGIFCSLIDDDNDALLTDKPVEEISTRRLDACPLIEIDLPDDFFPDVVRCGECSWYEKPSCRWHNIDNKPTDFCSYGERREP